MKTWTVMLGMLMCLLIVSMNVHAQAQQEKKSGDQVVTYLRVDIVLTEYNGDKKISSLPYAIYTAAPPQQGASSLRMGVRVPVASGSGNSFNYMNVGTEIDCFAKSTDEGSYNLIIGVNRSSIYAIPQGDSQSQGIRPLPDAPVVRNFDSRFDLSLRDGETKEGTSATDPLNGHVLKISVTLHVEK